MTSLERTALRAIAVLSGSFLVYAVRLVVFLAKPTCDGGYRSWSNPFPIYTFGFGLFAGFVSAVATLIVAVKLRRRGGGRVANVALALAVVLPVVALVLAVEAIHHDLCAGI